MFLRCALLSALAVAFLQGNIAEAAVGLATTDDQGVQVAELKEQLEKGLQARLPREFRFIATVVKMVEDGTLPLSLVRSTFQWARRQVTSRKYPFPYFERALRILAARRGIAIP